MVFTLSVSYNLQIYKKINHTKQISHIKTSNYSFREDKLLFSITSITSRSHHIDRLPQSHLNGSSIQGTGPIQQLDGACHYLLMNQIQFIDGSQLVTSATKQHVNQGRHIRDVNSTIAIAL